MSQIIVNCDGGSRGNPGPAAIGVVVRDSEKVLERYHEKLGEQTNNFAEYSGLIKSLELARKYGSEVVIIMDSELVVKQMLGEYAVKAENLIPLFTKAKQLEKEFNSVEYRHVLRDDNFQAMADQLVNQALDE